MEIIKISSLSQENIENIKNSFEQNGALVIQGLKLDALEFEKFTKLISDNFAYLASRDGLYISDNSDGFTSMTPQSSIGILSHCEGAYIPCFDIPDIGFLMCDEIEDNFVGKTYLVDGEKMLNNLPKKLKNRFINEKIIYEFLWNETRYKNQFNVSNKDELIELFRNTEDIKYKFVEDKLHLFYKSSGIKKLKNEKIVLSNGILPHLPNINHYSYKNNQNYIVDTNQVYWENMEPFNDETINSMLDSQDECKISYSWNKGDIFIFDNLKYMHGREVNKENSKRLIFSRFGYEK